MSVKIGSWGKKIYEIYLNKGGDFATDKLVLEGWIILVENVVLFLRFFLLLVTARKVWSLTQLFSAPFFEKKTLISLIDPRRGKYCSFATPSFLSQTLEGLLSWHGPRLVRRFQNLQRYQDAISCVALGVTEVPGHRPVKNTGLKP